MEVTFLERAININSNVDFKFISRNSTIENGRLKNSGARNDQTSILVHFKTILRASSTTRPPTFTNVHLSHKIFIVI